MPKRLGRPPGLTPDGPKIKRLRVDLGLTAAQLAPRVGLRHAKSLMAVESANRPISDVTASRLAKALGVRMRDITDWDGDDEDVSEPETPDRISA
jgi:transcriptional regulator with XRE-family HTH domain